MAQKDDAVTVHKRGPGRPPKGSVPVLKKQKATAPTPPRGGTPVVNSQAGESSTALDKNLYKLPTRILDSRPLPTLASPQSLNLQNNEYQSITASTVLPASLDRSRLKWVFDGILQRYWVKPESGKNAKPPPPNNPEAKWMKHRGQCRIRIEPHIFEADVYVEEKAKQPPPPKQYAPPLPFAQPYRPPAPSSQPYGQPHAQQFANRPFGSAVPPGTPQPQSPAGPLPPLQNTSQLAGGSPVPPVGRSPVPPPQPAQAAQDKKLAQDPVISMLASRASNDPELKALMKEVATGNATQDQLRVFQRHIDELTAIVQKQRKAEEAQNAKAQQQSSMIQYDGTADGTRPVQPGPPAVLTPRSYPAVPSPAPGPQQRAWTPPVPVSLPVIIGFSTTGATEDRFLFPQYSILESLSPQHTLVSFIVTRKGVEAVDPTGLDPEKEYWQPITMMAEVAYGREEILNCIRRWVKPADEVRMHMEEVMKRCQRAPETHLALQLPLKGTAMAESEESLREAIAAAEEMLKHKSVAKHAKKTPAAKAATAENTPAKDPNEPVKPSAPAEPPSETADGTKPPPESGSGNDGSATAEKPDEAATTSPGAEGGRPKRALRKSVRISEA